MNNLEYVKILRTLSEGDVIIVNVGDHDRGIMPSEVDLARIRNMFMDAFPCNRSMILPSYVKVQVVKKKSKIRTKKLIKDLE